ncbi:UNVERIFIED_CONTAM: hypothetical protein PYX00_010982 [Menopon gallinae]|uniref:ATP-dependent RNA helicase n=1 Tax=Menopon gallinae TaxID=328185 RepID=A0AAW2H6U7_9NEOP
MRFEEKISEATRIKVMTDGTLLQEMKKDKLLLAYQVIMIDEAHERSLNIDFILGLLRTIQNFRRDMKVIISSATLNTQTFSTYFNNAPIVSIKTPTYPVQIYYDPIPAPQDIKHLAPHLRPSFTREGIYIPNNEMLVEKICNLIGALLENKQQGDILVFLSGEKPIKLVIEKLREIYPKQLWVLPLYGRISQEEQQQVFLDPPAGKLKVVVGTNLMETSITIDGITTVIDSGLVKLNHYNHQEYNSALVEQAISQASADQRAGRAGRTQAGVCYRLYEAKSYRKRPLYTPEEIHRTDLSEVLMHMSELGLTNFETFPFISHPGKLAIQGARRTLETLGAIKKDNSLTPSGKLMASFPLLPKHARIIIEAMYRYPEALYNVTQGLAFLSTNSPFLFPYGEEIESRQAQKTFYHPKGDLIAYLKLFHSYIHSSSKQAFCEKYYLEYKTMQEIVNIQYQLQEIIAEKGFVINKVDNYYQYALCMGIGLKQNIARRVGRNLYASPNTPLFAVHPSSFLFHQNPEYIVCGEIVKTTRMFARDILMLEPSQVENISPCLYKALKSMRSLACKSAISNKNKSKKKHSQAFLNRECRQFLRQKSKGH